jgi:hypothetical protein
MLLGSGDGFGDRALAPVPQQQSTDMESVRIQSMDVLAEVVEAAADVVDDLGSITLADIEKLIKKTSLTKKDITDAIKDALTQPVLPVRDSAVLVRSQVKAEDVKEARSSPSSAKGKSSGPEDSSWLNDTSKSSGKGGPLLHIYDTYHKLIDLLDTATHRPLKLLDMGVDLLAKGADKIFGKGVSKLFGGASKKEGKEKDGFFGSGDEAGEGSREGSRDFVSGLRGQEQTATVTSNEFGSIFNPSPGFVSDDFQTATTQGGFPFSFFNAAPEPFSGNKQSESSFPNDGFPNPEPVFYSDMQPAESFGYSILSNDSPGKGSTGPVDNFTGDLVAGMGSVSNQPVVPSPVPFSRGDEPFPVSSPLVPSSGEPSPVSSPLISNPLVPSPVPFSRGGEPSPVSGLGLESSVGVNNPLSGFFDPTGEGSSSVSTADNVAVDSMESDIKANDILFRTFDEPEKSDFGRFLDFQISGGPSAQGKSKDKGLLGALVEGAVLAGLLFAMPFIVDKVIPFIKDDLIPFIKGPFLEFMGVAVGVVGSVARAVWPLVTSAFGAIASWLGANGEKVWGAISTAAGAIGKWLVGSVWPAITTAAEAIGGWLVANGPGIWKEITAAALAIGNWVKEEGWPALTGFLKEFGTFVKDTLWPFLKEVAAPIFGASLVNNFGMLKDFLGLFNPEKDKGEVFKNLAQRFSNAIDLLNAGIGSVVGGAGELLFPGNSASEVLRHNSMVTPVVTRNNVDGNRGSTFYLDKVSGELFSLPRGYNTENFKEQGIITPTEYNWSYISDMDKFPMGDATPLGEVPGVAESKDVEGVLSAGSEGPVSSVEDAIITSEGRVIHTDPDDNIYAFKGDVSIAPSNAGGSSVSMAPANAIKEFSGLPAGYNSQQSSVVNNVTNNYVNNSNFNLSDLLPGSEFDPVGV